MVILKHAFGQRGRNKIKKNSNPMRRGKIQKQLYKCPI